MNDILERARLYLQQMPPAVSGNGGHDQTFAAACALVHGFDLSEADAIRLLTDYSHTCQPPWSPAEIAHKVASAMGAAHAKPRGHLIGVGGRKPWRYQSGPATPPLARPSPTPNGRRPPPLTNATPPATYDITQAQPTDLPEPMDDPTRNLIRLAFEPGEGIGIAQERLNDDGKGIPSDAGATLSREEWLRKLDAKDGDPNKVWSTPAKTGAFIRINPMRIGGSKAADVTAFRHVLVEFDDHTLAEQWSLIVQSRIPCTAVLSSGGRSLHAWVRVDAADRREFVERRDVLFAHFAACGHPPDQKNKDPGRFSRLPGMVRGENRQSLLAVGVGATSWGEWIAEQSDITLPQELPLDRLITFDPNNDPNSMIGNRWLCRGGTMIIQGQSGIGKSSLLMQMVITWATGKPLFGIAPKQPLRSMVIQSENDSGDMAEMFQGVCQGIGVDMRDPLLLSNIRIFRESVRSGEAFVDAVWRLWERAKDKPDIILADPLLAYLADDVSKQAVVSEFLRTRLSRLIEATRVIWIWMHHTGKPSNDPKARSTWTDKDLSYAGLGSSDLANWARETAVLQRCSQDQEVYRLTLTKRGKRSGMTDLAGNVTTSITLKHSDRGICWEQVEDTQEEATRPVSKAGRPPTYDPAKFDFAALYTRISSPPGQAFSLTQLESEIAKVAGASPRTIAKFNTRSIVLERLKKHPDDHPQKGKWYLP